MKHRKQVIALDITNFHNAVGVDKFQQVRNVLGRKERIDLNCASFGFPESYSITVVFRRRRSISAKQRLELIRSSSQYTFVSSDFDDSILALRVAFTIFRIHAIFICNLNLEYRVHVLLLVQ